MPRSSDKLFHLTVSIFAIGLTVVSVATLVNQRTPERLRNWLHSVAQNATPSTDNQPPHAFHGTDSYQNALKNGTGGDKSATNQAVTHHAAVHVIGFGTDVSLDKVQQVRQLLSDQHITDVVSNTLQMDLHGPVQIYLAQTAADYKNALKKLGVSVEDAQRFSSDTGGFTMGDNIVIPLYQNKTTADLTNTLGHELTHAYLNGNVGDIPSWLNEGLAVYTGMRVQAHVQDPVAYAGYEKQMAESVLDASSTGHLVPLADDEEQVLKGDASYDLELQDWLAVQYLIDKHGTSTFHTYFQTLNSGHSHSEAFQKAFQETPNQFNVNLTKLLQDAASAKDQGVTIQLTSNGTFQGYVRMLQHGTSIWRGLPMSGQQKVFTISPGGSLLGSFEGEEATKDTNSPDDSTLYIDLDPSKPLYYKGKQVDYCGFAIDYHHGLYGFVNAWITYKNGKTEYLQAPNLFGVNLTKVTEVSTDNLILSILQTTS